MKKHLLITAIICIATIPPATAITKCVYLRPGLSCGIISPSGQVDWTINCASSTGGPGTQISGIGACSFESGTSSERLPLKTSTSLPPDYSIEQHDIYCWCRMTTPAVSSWIYLRNYNTNGDCVEMCAFHCGQNFYTNTNFMRQMMTTISD